MMGVLDVFAGIIAGILFLIVLLLVIVLFNRIRIAIELIKEASRCALTVLSNETQKSIKTRLSYTILMHIVFRGILCNFSWRCQRIEYV